MRIAIVGAGCSGITAAYKLHELGYKNITLYEANERIGGRIQSIKIDDQVIELGAVTYLKDNPTLHNMASEIGDVLGTKFKPDIVVVRKTPDASTRKLGIDRYWGTNARLGLTLGLLRFWRIVWLSPFRSALNPGFYNLHPDLVNLTMTQFARKYGFAAILTPYHAMVSACGYGSMDEIPAIYLLKMMKSLEAVRLHRQITLGRHTGLYAFEGGFQRFWEMVAHGLLDSGLDLRVGSRVTRVVRRAVNSGRCEIDVTADGSTEVYDRIFVATPPDRILEFLDATDEEAELLGRVSYFNYRTVVFRAEALKKNETVLITHNMTRNRHGHLVAYFNDAPQVNLFVGYQCDDALRSEEEFDDLARRDIAEIGGTVSGIVARKTWKQFPHVKLEDLDVDYYPRLNALQGERGTHYLGGIFAFESTGHCVQFAEFIVNQFHAHETQAARS